MKKRLLSLCMPIGLLIYWAYRIMDHISPISDVAARPMFISSVTFMLIGCIYSGWCFGKRRNLNK